MEFGSRLMRMFPMAWDHFRQAFWFMGTDGWVAGAILRPQSHPFNGY
jgi:hypothetical protein